MAARPPLSLPHSLLELLHHHRPARIPSGLLKLRLLPGESLWIRRNSPRVNTGREALLLAPLLLPKL